jgi:hypothetical protein
MFSSAMMDGLRFFKLTITMPTIRLGRIQWSSWMRRGQNTNDWLQSLGRARNSDLGDHLQNSFDYTHRDPVALDWRIDRDHFETLKISTELRNHTWVAFPCL